jgi:oligopeptide/dipeptide ABC transporter ATP-binding protein
VPSLEQDRARLAAIPGTLPDPASRPPGCRYAPRCALRIEACTAAIPALVEIEGEHAAACIRAART